MEAVLERRTLRLYFLRGSHDICEPRESVWGSDRPGDADLASGQAADENRLQKIKEQKECFVWISH